MPEISREKFVRLANRRVNTALKAIQLVGNLSNRSNYAYTDSDVEKIFSVMNRELKEARERFRANGKPGQAKVELK